MDWTGTQILKSYYLAVFLETCEPKRKYKQLDVSWEKPANLSVWAVALGRKEMLSSDPAIFPTK